MARWWKAALFSALVLFVVSGCFDYEEEITLNANGSGTVRVHYFTEESYAPMFEGEDSPFTLDQETLAQRLEGTTAKLQSSKVYTEDGLRHAVFALEFTDLEKLAGNWPFEDRTFSLERRSDGLYVYRSVISFSAEAEVSQELEPMEVEEEVAAEEEEPEESGEDYAEEGGDESAEMEAAMNQATQEIQAALVGHSFKYILTLPGKIVEAGEGGIIEGTQVTWEFPLAELEGRDEIVLTATFKP